MILKLPSFCSPEGYYHELSSCVFLQTCSVPLCKQNSMFPAFRGAKLFLEFPSSCPQIASVPLRLLGLPEAPLLPDFLHTSWAEEFGRNLPVHLRPARRVVDPGHMEMSKCYRELNQPHVTVSWGLAKKAATFQPSTFQAGIYILLSRTPVPLSIVCYLSRAYFF